MNTFLRFDQDISNIFLAHDSDTISPLFFIFLYYLCAYCIPPCSLHFFAGVHLNTHARCPTMVITQECNCPNQRMAQSIVWNCLVTFLPAPGCLPNPTFHRLMCIGQKGQLLGWSLCCGLLYFPSLLYIG
ncbi:hypothetical protein CPB84DRAFT_1212681 [Gymnopilus junonius]|uniref:Uncharacterized protein n=1 Tax=Gymnopilus junonius TaxID=109634 RepID=A0A9P5TM18_GYMJU|nr:hypothetical protein CPB84DRAFT_1212681 [Gymnopilus junonius]